MGGVSRAPYVLLPPSESKEPGGHREVAPGFFDSALSLPREQVRLALARTLAGVSPDVAAKVLNSRGPNLQRALEVSREFTEGTALVLPAWQRYNGVVWSHLDPISLSDAQRRRLLVPSGAYGLALGTDVIADYRLTLKVRLDGIGTLARFWRVALTPALEEFSDFQMVSLLPKEHAAVIGASEVPSGRLVTVSFQQHDGEGAVGHDAKAVKGVVARRVLLDGLDAVEGFRWKGWRGKIHRGDYVVRAPRVPAP